MSGKRWAKSRDANELDIVKALRARGVSVYRIESSLDPGVFDLLCEVECPAIARMLGDLDNLANGLRDDAIRSWAGFRYTQLRPLLRRWVLLEVKNPATGTGCGTNKRVRMRDLDEGGKYHGVLEHCSRDVARQLKETQADFLLRHQAPRYVVTSVEDALRACGLEPEEKT